MKENENKAKRDTSHFKIYLLSEISQNTEFNMLKFITTSFKVSGIMNQCRATIELSAESVERTTESNLIEKIDSYVVLLPCCCQT